MSVCCFSALTDGQLLEGSSRHIEWWGRYDRLEGATGVDNYAFTVAPGTANADVIVGFVPGSETIMLDAAVHTNLGSTGDFATGDKAPVDDNAGEAQFVVTHASATATEHAHEASIL